MFEKLNKMNFEIAEAHCDGPCGVYDPAQARIEAESVLQLTKKILDLKMPEGDDAKAHAAYHNTLTRFITIKEARAELAKHHLLVLWTDYFKPAHLEKYPDLHEIFWKAAKACSSCKQEVSLEHAEELMGYIKRVHEIFWETKNKEVAWYTAS
ncbi:MAG TPA: superoxide dismutase, Ni [Pyrinomonadaceae bacterium]|jgi:nickel superoxide dismutase|nr:superoxide dismutase, Ni [Pyrinomonadaceae bacterium]